MKLHHGIQLPACAVAALVLSSCVVKDGSLDFTWWKDAAAPAMDDDVIIDSGSGHRYQSTPAPVRVPDTPLAGTDTQVPAQPTATAKATSQQQPGVAPPSSSPNTYIVQKGDTLSALARRYGTSVSALVAANSMPSANEPLRIGQTLVISRNINKPAAATPGVHSVQPGDTLYAIARRYGVSPAALMQANGLTPATANTIRVGTTLRIPAK